MSIFTIPSFQFPYPYKFPGQASDEVILFVTRENKIMLYVRMVAVILASLSVLIIGSFLAMIVGSTLGEFQILIQLLAVGLAIIFGVVGWYFVSSMWMKSICIVTTKRLVKYIYTTPFNRHSLSLPLREIVDTGSYTKGYIQAIFRLSTFTARSSASGTGVASDEEMVDRGSRVNKKYFYIENIAIAEDLQHYLNKLLDALRSRPEDISSFRPFVPHLKGEARANFMKNYEGYWS